MNEAIEVGEVNDVSQNTVRGSNTITKVLVF